MWEEKSGRLKSGKKEVPDDERQEIQTPNTTGSTRDPGMSEQGDEFQGYRKADRKRSDDRIQRSQKTHKDFQELIHHNRRNLS